jgi:hypothetical protein
MRPTTALLRAEEPPKFFRAFEHRSSLERGIGPPLKSDPSPDGGGGVERRARELEPTGAPLMNIRSITPECGARQRARVSAARALAQRRPARMEVHAEVRAEVVR